MDFEFMPDQINKQKDALTDACCQGALEKEIHKTIESGPLTGRPARSGKMEALEVVASGVAHDLNNILSGIVTYPELLLMRKDLDEKTRKALKVIRDSGERVAALIGDLTTIARNNASNREEISINSMVQEYLQSPDYRKLQLSQDGIALKLNLDSRLFTIDASRLHIRRSVMHLVANAAEAIGSNGQILISTANCLLGVPLRPYSEVKKGEYALLTVAHTGGISEQHIDRIFEPFYTRKVMGRKGTGLELTVVWYTAADHNGYAVVTGDTTSTRFDLYFPRTRHLAREQGCE